MRNERGLVNEHEGLLSLPNRLQCRSNLFLCRAYLFHLLLTFFVDLETGSPMISPCILFPDKSFTFLQINLYVLGWERSMSQNSLFRIRPCERMSCKGLRRAGEMRIFSPSETSDLEVLGQILCVSSMWIISVTKRELLGSVAHLKWCSQLVKCAGFCAFLNWIWVQPVATDRAHLETNSSEYNRTTLNKVSIRWFCELQKTKSVKGFDSNKGVCTKARRQNRKKKMLKKSLNIWLRLTLVKTHFINYSILNQLRHKNRRI